MLKQRTPMKRGKGFKRKLPPGYELKRYGESTIPPDLDAKLDRLLKPWARGTYSASTSVQVVPKENAISHEGYRRLVAALPCARCGIQGYTQVCHTDFGKGMGMKTDDRGCWPGCGPRPSGFGGITPGCHYVVGTSGLLDRETRRALEKQYAEQTQRDILASGKWPKGLPLPASLNATPTGELP